MIHPTPPPQEIIWVFPRDGENLKRWAAYSGAVTAITDWPQVTRDVATLEAQRRALLVVQRTHYGETFSNDFATYCDIYLTWYLYGYQVQCIRYDNDPSTVQSDKANLEVVMQENLLAEVFRWAQSLDG